MRSLAAFVLLTITLGTVACLEKAPVKAVVPVTPPPPAPPPLPPPVIEPQTVARLPEPQAIPPDALPARPPVEYRPAAEAAPPTVSPAPARRGSPARAATPPPPEPVGATTPPVEEPAVPKPSQTLRSKEDQLTSKDSIAAILDDVRRELSAVQSRPKSATATAAVNRVTSLVRLAEQSSAKSELRQAESLAKRALALARDLNRPG